MTIWRGELLNIHIAESAGAPMLEMFFATVLRDLGVAGDRYAAGKGKYSPLPGTREVTIIGIETIEALEREHKIVLAPNEHRRNLTVKGVPLDRLVGKRFSVGPIVLEGALLSRFCPYLELLTNKNVFRPLIGYSSLNCRVIHGGTLKPGVNVHPLPDP